MALLVFAMLGLGWGRTFAPGIWKPLITQAHVITGMLLLILLPVRLCWRFYDKPPALLESLLPVQKLAAHAMHILLYILLFVMPLSGWLMLSAMGRKPSFLGVFELPPLLQKTPSLVPVLKSLHGLMAQGFAVFVILHLAAGLLHHFVHRDETLTRMLPFLNKRA
jgi:cytochrome b561